MPLINVWCTIVAMWFVICISVEWETSRRYSIILYTLVNVKVNGASSKSSETKLQHNNKFWCIPQVKGNTSSEGLNTFCCFS